MLVLKIRCQDEIRRISLEKDPTFNELVSTLKKLFNIDEDSNEEFHIKYVDEDDDLITIATDVDVQEALRVYYQQKLQMLKLFLTKYLLTSEQLEQKRKRFPNRDQKPQTEQKPLKEEPKKEEPKKEEPSIAPSPAPAPEVPAPVVQENVAVVVPQKDNEPSPKPVVEEVVAKAPSAEEEELAKKLTDDAPAPAPSQNEETKPKEEQAKPAEQDDAEWIEFKTRTGKTVYLNMKAGSLKKYGIEPFTRVNTLRGPATVFGVDKERGYLWFQLDKDNGVSFWDDIVNADSLTSKGVTILEQPKNVSPATSAAPSPVTATPSPSNQTNKNANVNNNASAPIPIPKPISPINNNSSSPNTVVNATKPTAAPPAWNRAKAAEYGFAVDDEEARMIEMALAESLKTFEKEHK